jgi:hypothetical protein
MSDPKTERPTSRGFSWITALWIGMIIVALYVLSIGPVARMYKATATPPGKAIRAFYAPLSFLHERVPFAKQTLDWYLKLWGANP